MSVKAYGYTPAGFDSSESTEFTYNCFGQRVRKEYSYYPGPDYSGDFTVGKEVNYDYDHSGRLIREVSTEQFTESASETVELIFLYDESGMIGFTYSRNGSTPQAYYYHRNLQGDVVAIYNTSGVKVASYVYDAWGNCTASGSIAPINPIRYRGYYWDSETGWYYLNARYYSPEWRRFISPDDINYLDPESVNGLNLYCYCNNDPVNYCDPSGHLALSSFLFGLGIAAAIGAGVGAASYTAGQLIDYAFTGDFEWSWGGFVGSTVGGVLGGMAAYSFNLLQLGMVGVFVSGFSTTAITMVGENITNDASHTSNDIFAKSFVDGLFSIISSGVMKNIKFAPINSGRGSYSAISKQMYTKITNGTITRISAKTLGKMFISEFYDGLFGLILN